MLHRLLCQDTETSARMCRSVCAELEADLTRLVQRHAFNKVLVLS